MKPCTSSDAIATEGLHQQMLNLKAKFQTTESYTVKVQILTCKPAPWSIEKTAQFFQCKLYTIQHALALKSEHGILAKSTQASRKGIDEKIVSLLHSFYQDDEFLKLLPGSKDFVSIGYKVHQQKRLLLCNLKELFVEFKNHHQNKFFQILFSLIKMVCFIRVIRHPHSLCMCYSPKCQAFGYCLPIRL